MSKTDNAVKMAMEQYRKEYGEDARLEEGEEFVTVFNDGVIIIGLENRCIDIKILVGKPYHTNCDLGLTELG